MSSWTSEEVVQVVRGSRREPQDLECRALRVAAETAIWNYELGGPEYQDTLSHEVRHMEEDPEGSWKKLDARVRELLREPR